MFLELAGFALSAGSQLLGDAAQNKAAKLNAMNALQAYGLNTRDMSERETGARAAAAQEKDLLGLQGSAARSTAQASAAESGVAGASVDALLADLLAQEAYAAGTVDTNLDLTLGELSRRREGAGVEYEGRRAGMQTANPLAAAVGIGSAALNTYGLIKRNA